MRAKLRLSLMPRHADPTRFLRNQRGIVAVEFAFIAPILVLAYFGVAELCGAMLQQRTAVHVASEIGDLFAQCQTYADSDFANFWSIGTTIMYPLDTSTLSMRLTLIQADSTGTVFSVPTDGSHVSGTGFTALPAGTYTDASLVGIVPASGQVRMSGSQKCSASIRAISSNCHPMTAVAATKTQPISDPAKAAQTPMAAAPHSISM